MTAARTHVPAELLGRLTANIESVFSGKTEVVDLVVTCLLAGGHVLLEDVPGVGKTTLAQALALSIHASFQRIQFTSDLLPSDILGVSIFLRDEGRFEFKRGPIFANVVLADEINRTTPRTQSALLEAMSERRVSMDDQTHDLPPQFVVIATQNPLEYHGTYPLPESQLDRFLMRLSIGYPGRDVERELVLHRRNAEPVQSLGAVLELEELEALQTAVGDVRMDPSLADYILDVIAATRTSSALRTGVSTRGALALARAVRAHALVRGRDFVTPDDVTSLLVPVLAHRISLAGAAGTLGGGRSESEAIIEELASQVDLPV
jgi:MoxR-like ATPase